MGEITGVGEAIGEEQNLLPSNPSQLLFRCLRQVPQQTQYKRNPIEFHLHLEQ